MNHYKQSLSNSCLATCLLIVQREKYNTKFSANDEKKITLEGSSRKYPSYVAGIAKEFMKKYKRKLKIIADNKYFAKVLKKSIQDKRAKVENQKITLKCIESQLKHGPVICHIDDHFLGDYSHVSHFIVIEKMKAKKVLIIDPWHGKRKSISQEKLEKSILSLKSHVKMCPLLFQL